MITKIATNSLIVSFSQISARLLGFLFFVLLARYLGVANFGIYNFTLAFVYNFVPVADFGLERLVLRDISRAPEEINYYIARLLPLRLFLSAGSYLGIILLGITLGQTSRQILYLAIFGLYIFPNTFIYLLASFQNAKEEMKYFSLALLTAQILTVAIGVLFIFLKFPLIMIFLASVLGQMIVLIFFFLKASCWGIKMGWVIDMQFFKEALGDSWVFACITIISVFYLKLSILLISLLRGDEATGLYSSSFRFIEASILIPQSIALALFPLSARLFLEDKRKLVAIYKKGLGILFLLSLPFSIVMIFLSKQIVLFAYGQDYAPAIPVFSVLGFSLILFFLNALSGNIIQNSPQFKKFLPITLIKVFFSITIFLILIPRFGILGAAWGVVIGEAFGLIINNIFVLFILKNKDD